MTAQPSQGNGSHILATDLDGTLIPLEGNQQNRDDLEALTAQLRLRHVTLIFVTGRHLDSVRAAIDEFRLPQPDWIICDVGTSLFRRCDPETFEPVDAYRQHQDEIVRALPINALREQLKSIEGLRLQEQEKQGRFKLSFYADAANLDSLVSQIQQDLDRSTAPYSIVHSVDPFNGDGLIDLLPATVSKAHALSWWVEYTGRNPEDIVFAGDSGNDLAALTAGYQAILVGNADRKLAQQVQAAHSHADWLDRLYLAHAQATSGLLEGCRNFGLI